MATEAELRRLNRLGGLSRADRAAELNPTTHDEVLSAVAGQICDEFPTAKIEPSTAGAHVLSVSLPAEDGGDFLVGLDRDGRIIARRP